MYQLYYAPDNASLIVRMVLEELDADYETILVDRSNNFQRSEEYLRLNPNGLIPVLIMNEQPIYETGAIILSLSERHRELAPGLNDSERPQFLKWLFFLSNSVHVDLRQLFYPQQYVGETTEALFEHRQLTEQRLKQRLAALDTHCAAQEGDYLMDEEFTVLDIYLAVMLRWVQLFPREQCCLDGLHEYPALRQLCDSVARRSGVRAACEKEGIADPFFDRPSHAQPSEGSAT